MGKSEELRDAHADLDESIESDNRSRLTKSLDALKSRFGFGQDDLNKANSSTMPGNDGYPQAAVNEGNIARARAKSKPAKHPDGNYEGLESADQDTTDYENSEDDALDGFGGKKVTEKSRRGVSEEDFYKAVVNADESGEVVEAINASEALELLATSMGKSIADVSRIQGEYAESTNGSITELGKSLGVVAEAIGAIIDHLEKSGTPVAAVQAASADITSEEERKTGEESTEEVEKSMGPDERKYRKTLEFLADADKMNAPSYFSQITGEALKKSGGDAQDNTPETLNTFAGRQRVKRIVTDLVKSNQLDPDFLGALDYRPTSEVVGKMSRELREKVGLV